MWQEHALPRQRVDRPHLRQNSLIGEPLVPEAHVDRGMPGDERPKPRETDCVERVVCGEVAWVDVVLPSPCRAAGVADKEHWAGLGLSLQITGL